MPLKSAVFSRLVVKKKHVFYPMLLVLIAIGGILAICMPVLAQEQVEFQYIYDENQRLVRAIDSEGNVLTYTYDPVGNVLSITRGNAADLVPVITGVTPNTVNQGETVELLITGTGFLGRVLTTDNPGITIERSRGTDTEVTATLIVAPDARLGPTTLTVTTSLGFDSATITVLGPVPTVVGISPSRGTSAGGTPVTISGTNLTPDTIITIGGNPATDVVFVDSNTITARTPAGTPGSQVDVVVRNSNGSSTLTGGFVYTFPFGLPGAVAIVTEGTGTVTVTLDQPFAVDTTAFLSSSNTSVATVPDFIIILAGATSFVIPITAVSEGTAIITVTINGVSLSFTVFVGPAFIGDLDLVAAPVGSFVTPIGGITLAPVVGTFVTPIGGITLAPIVGAQVAPSLLPTVVLTSGATKTVTLPLAEPAPGGGLTVGIAISDPTVATVPTEVVIAGGEQTVSFDVTGLASGEALITVTAGADIIVIKLLVDRALGIPGAGLAPPVGTFVTPVGGTTLAPIVGVEVLPLP